MLRIYYNLEEKDTRVIKEALTSGADIEFIKDTTTKMTPLMSAIKNYKIDIAKYLIEAGAEVNAKDKKGNTPLHYVKNKELAEILIEAGANVNAKNKYGQTPLTMANINNKLELVSYIGKKIQEEHDLKKSQNSPSKK